MLWQKVGFYYFYGQIVVHCVNANKNMFMLKFGNFDEIYIFQNNIIYQNESSRNVKIK